MARKSAPGPAPRSDAAAPRTDAAARWHVGRALVLADESKPAVAHLVERLGPWLGRRGATVERGGDARAFRERCAKEGLPSDRPDLVIVLGGDGSLLAAVQAFADRPVPTLGINFGRVGFLASTPASRWEETLDAVLGGRGVLERRVRLCAEFEGEKGASRGRVRAVALNEVVIQRSTHQGMLTCSLSADGAWVTSYRADGLIIATPSGSTGYSLSSGGPILPHGMEGLVVTPIASQSLANRALVLGADRRLTVVVAQAQGVTTLVIDGQVFYRLEEGDAIDLFRHPDPYPLYAMPGLDPYRRLRERLGWSGSPDATSEHAQGLSGNAAPARAKPRRADPGESGTL